LAPVHFPATGSSLQRTGAFPCIRFPGFIRYSAAGRSAPGSAAASLSSVAASGRRSVIRWYRNRPGSSCITM